MDFYFRRIMHYGIPDTFGKKISFFYLKINFNFVVISA